jgi:hypothetical protein
MSLSASLLLLSLISTAAQYLPLAYSPLPFGSLHPEGWLNRELKVQGDGLSGNFAAFYEPVYNSQWLGGNSTHEDWMEIFPYVLAGYVPQAILLNDDGQLKQSQIWIDTILNRALPTGWLGPETQDASMRFWPQWPVVLTFLTWFEYGIAVNSTGDPRLITASLACLHNASAMLALKPMGVDYSGTRWQDFIFMIHAVRDFPATPSSELGFLDEFAAAVHLQGVQNCSDWAEYYTDKKFPHGDSGSWSFQNHGVNNAMAAKSGAVSWRAGFEPNGNVSSYERISLYDKYQGAPSGVFQADECFAGNMASRGTETCAVVELMFSYNIIFSIQGDAFFAERAERIMYNALPATGTKDRWTRVYLQQPNEIVAVTQKNHVWRNDGPDALLYSLEGNYACCTANFNQGLPRGIQRMLHTTNGGDGLVISTLGPVSARLSSGVAVNISGDYPFFDDITITLTNLPNGIITFPLFIRIPSWSTNATLIVGSNRISVGGANGTLYQVPFGSTTTGPTVVITLSTNPSIRFEQHSNGAFSIYRGALLYALQLDEILTETSAASKEPRAKNYNITQPSGGRAWNVAIVTGGGNPENAFTFTRVGPVPDQPWEAGKSPIQITAQVRTVTNWVTEIGSAATVPSSPIDCSQPGSCSSNSYTAIFVPYGSTHLRIASLPWTSV